MIYLIRCLTTELVKVGYTKDVRTRFLGLRNSSPTPLELMACWHGGAREEALVHELFDDRRDHGEWFRVPHGEALASLTEAMGPPEPTPSITTDGRRRGGRGNVYAAPEKPHPDAYMNQQGRWEHQEYVTHTYRECGTTYEAGSVVRVVHYRGGPTKEGVIRQYLPDAPRGV